MFTYDSMIDAVQNGKKQFVKTFVTNETIATNLTKFIDAQADYTKAAFKVTSDTTTAIAQEMVKSIQEATKFDYSKFGEGIMKAYQNNFTRK
jgi:hypothetical protein